MDKSQKILVVMVLVLTTAVEFDAVSVNPSLCPTNKIAPHRRHTRQSSRPRTLGLVYSLLSPDRPRPPPLNDIDDLQEQPEDDPDDCGEIEDYDETDLSSITPGAHNNIYKHREHRLILDNYIVPSYYPQYPAVPISPNKPIRPQRPPYRPQKPTYPPIKPPFGSGGIFGSNVYRPPFNHYPSNYVKPVQEHTYDNPPEPYRPGLVGGTLGHIMGFPPVKPPANNDVTSQKRPSNHVRFPDDDARRQRRSRSKQTIPASSILGSFLDFIFK